MYILQNKKFFLSLLFSLLSPNTVGAAALEPPRENDSM